MRKLSKDNLYEVRGSCPLEKCLYPGISYKRKDKNKISQPEDKLTQTGNLMVQWFIKLYERPSFQSALPFTTN